MLLARAELPSLRPDDGALFFRLSQGASPDHLEVAVVAAVCTRQARQVVQGVKAQALVVTAPLRPVLAEQAPKQVAVVAVALRQLAAERRVEQGPTASS
jgi:hypothetical protein